MRVLRWLAAVLVLPVNAALVVPLSLLWLFGFDIWESGRAAKGLALFIGLGGLVLSLSALNLFFRQKDGTPAPWDPIKRLVVTGPYRYMRNPMLVGVIMILFCEALFFMSSAIFVYGCLFSLGNHVYFKCVEEPGLVKRYGRDYQLYLANVPRWMPRMTPYAPDGGYERDGDGPSVDHH